MWFGETVAELMEVETELVSVPTSGVLDLRAELDSGGFDLLVAELSSTGLPAALDRLLTNEVSFPVLGIGNNRAVLYEGNAPPVDLGDRSLRNVLAGAREVAFALHMRRSK